MYKKIDFRWLVLLLVAVFGMSLASCSDDDDDDDKGGIVGTWEEKWDDWGCTFVFSSNGTGIYQEYGYEEDNSDGFRFKYKMNDSRSGEIIILDEYGDEDESLPFRIDGNVMYIYEDDSYEDLEWTLYKK